MEFELNILRAIQSIASPVLDAAAEAVTMAGEQVVLLAVFCLVYWVISKPRGQTMGLTILTSLFVNNTLKELFNLPRPIGEEGIRSLRTETATGKSFPSGHSQASAATYTSAVLGLKKRPLAIAAGSLMVLVALSRLYLGVHYPKDVLAGLALGIGAAYLCRYLMAKTSKTWILYAAVNVLMLLMLFVYPSEDGITAAGLALGIFAGFLTENHYIRFTTDGLTKKQKILRYLIGIALVLAVYALPKLLISSDLGIVRYLRYALVSYTAAAVAPYVFTKCKC